MPPSELGSLRWVLEQIGLDARTDGVGSHQRERERERERKGAAALAYWSWGVCFPPSEPRCSRMRSLFADSRGFGGWQNPGLCCLGRCPLVTSIWLRILSTAAHTSQFEVPLPRRGLFCKETHSLAAAARPPRRGFQEGMIVSNSLQNAIQAEGVSGLGLPLLYPGVSPLALLSRADFAATGGHADLGH